MRNLLLVILLIANSCCFANNNSVTDVDREISKTLATAIGCWNNGNLKCFMDTLYVKSDKTLFISGTKFIYGWQNSYNHYKDKYGNAKSNMGNLQVKIEKVLPLDADHAFAYGRYHLQVKNKTYNGVTSLLFCKSNGIWKIIVDHSS